MEIVSGDNLVLRDRLPSDADRFIYWQTHGEWRRLDAPWEGVRNSLTAKQEAGLRAQFLELCAGGLPSPRETAIVAGKDGRPLGWVNRYVDESTPGTWMVGIDICEDDVLNRGLGTQALGLWVDYLFASSEVNRLGLDTWSFNPRMGRVAEKLGFAPESVQHEVRLWKGRWLDLIHFGLTRDEWEERRTQAAGRD